MHQWYALQVRTNRERVVADTLTSKGLETFLPCYTVRRQWKDRIHETEAPLFSGYSFCRFDPVARLPILTTPGVVSIVSYGSEPAAIDEGEIVAIRAAISRRGNVEPWAHPTLGQVVQIERGPLAGMSGVLVSVKSSLRIVLSISLIQRSVAAEIDASMIARPPGNTAAPRPHCTDNSPLSP
jgi:transcription antitermination factor NusG